MERLASDIQSEGRFDEEKTGAVMLGECTAEVPAETTFMVGRYGWFSCAQEQPDDAGHGLDATSTATRPGIQRDNAL